MTARKFQLVPRRSPCEERRRNFRSACATSGNRWMPLVRSVTREKLDYSWRGERMIQKRVTPNYVRTTLMNLSYPYSLSFSLLHLSLRFFVVAPCYFLRREMPAILFETTLDLRASDETIVPASAIFNIGVTTTHGRTPPHACGWKTRMHFVTILL